MNINKKLLNKALSELKKVASKSVFPKSILISESNAHIKLTATDLEVFLTHEIEIENSQGRTFQIDANLFTAAAKNAVETNGNVTIEYCDVNKTVKIGNASLPTVLNDWPKLPDMFLEGSTIDMTQIRGAIDNVSHAISTDQRRYNLNGVHFSDDSNIVATDGYRLAWQVACFPLFLSNTILPSVCLPYLKHDFWQLDANFIELTHSVTKVVTKGRLNFVKFTGKNVTMIVKMIDGDFPQWKRVIPCLDNSQSTTFNTSEIVPVLDQIISMAKVSRDEPHAKISMNGKMSIDTMSLENGESHNEIATGNPVNECKFSMNARYLNDVCKLGEQVKIQLPNYNYSKDTGPLVFTVGEVGAVIMPMRI